MACAYIRGGPKNATEAIKMRFTAIWPLKNGENPTEIRRFGPHSRGLRVQGPMRLANHGTNATNGTNATENDFALSH